VIRPLDFLQAVPSRSFCSMPLAGHSPTLPFIVLCDLFLTPVRESVVSPVQALKFISCPPYASHPGCTYVVWMCYLLADQMLKTP